MKKIIREDSEFVIQETKTTLAKVLQKRKLAYWLYENKIYTVDECSRLLNESRSTFYYNYRKYMEGVAVNENE